MKLVLQVSSLAPSKRLKELGMKQESCFHWDPIWGATDIATWELWERTDCPSRYAKLPEENYSAFTVAELGEMLPTAYQTNRRLNGQWECVQVFRSTTEQVDGKIVTTTFPEAPVAMFEDTEADARAKMLIYLLENKLITL